MNTTSPDGLDDALMATSQRVIAIQLVGPNGDVVKRAGAAPATALVPGNRFDDHLLRGLSDDEVANDDMRVSGQRVNTPHGTYTVIVGGGSEAVEATARTVAALLACGAPIIVGVAAAATYRLVRRSLQSVDAIRSRVAEISASDLAERVPVPASSDEISALAVTMNEMLARLESSHQRPTTLCRRRLPRTAQPLDHNHLRIGSSRGPPRTPQQRVGKHDPAPRGAPHANPDRRLAAAG